MKKYSNIFLIANLIAILAFVNYSAFHNEKIRNEGTTIYAELNKEGLKQPLFQGDAMNLHYTIAKSFLIDTLYMHGYVVVTLDSNAIASRVRFQQFNLPKAPNEYLIAYSKNGRGLQVGPEQYFMQQGDAKKYVWAKYGCLKVDAVGKTLLMGLYDSTLHKIE